MSFDGGFAAQAAYERPDRYRMIEGDCSDTPRIARGGGYSYAAASFGADAMVLDMTRFDRVLRFDPGARLVEVEAGMQLGDLLDLTAPQGLWLPVQPGYPAITVGGCIAANVHGKNPYREGTFLGSVQELTLFHPRRGTVRVDREREPEVFELTCGGYGLTGVILSATLRLEPLPGAGVSVRRIPIGTLAEGLAAVREETQDSTFAYTWHDGSPVAGTLGRGFVFRADIPPGPLPARGFVPPYRRIDAARRARLAVPLWGRFTTRLLGAGFRLLESRRPEQTRIPLFDAIFPFARRGEYFVLFGRRGLAEYQALVPDDAVGAFLAELEREILAHRAPVVMMSMKLFRGTQRFLRFERDGVCVTLDLVRSAAGLDFLARLDGLVAEAGGLPHIIKDSRLPAAVVRRCYPEYELFRERLRAYDPERIFVSELSRMLAL